MANFTFLSLAAGLFSFAAAKNPTATYTNPVLSGVAADPWVIQHNGLYYMTYTNGVNITVLKSPVLTDWDNAEVKTVFNPPPNEDYSTDLWAPVCFRSFKHQSSED